MENGIMKLESVQDLLIDRFCDNDGDSMSIAEQELKIGSSSMLKDDYLVAERPSSPLSSPTKKDPPLLSRIASSEVDDGYWNEHGVGLGMELDTESAELASTIRAVALHLEGTLRAAKKAHLSCGEVLLPPQLLQHIARDIIRMAESEPCGLRGCLILLSFESGHPAASNHQNNSTNNNNNSPSATANTRKIGKIKCDKNTVNTFELNLLLREEPSAWFSRLPQILRNLTKGGTIVISPKYEISKKKLYRSHN